MKFPWKSGPRPLEIIVSSSRFNRAHRRVRLRLRAFGRKMDGNPVLPMDPPPLAHLVRK